MPLPLRLPSFLHSKRSTHVSTKVSVSSTPSCLSSPKSFGNVFLAVRMIRRPPLWSPLTPSTCGLPLIRRTENLTLLQDEALHFPEDERKFDLVFSVLKAGRSLAASYNLQTNIQREFSCQLLHRLIAHITIQFTSKPSPPRILPSSSRRSLRLSV